MMQTNVTTSMAGMQTCSIRTRFQSTFTGKPKALHLTVARTRSVQSGHGRLLVHANIDTGYKKTADADSGKSTVEDQLHEAEANKNAQSFVKEFKEDLGATGEKKSKQDNEDIKERESDKVGLDRAQKEAESAQKQQ